MRGCIFCSIVAKKAPAEIIWENDNHLAFLSIFPNTQGFTVVATKEHYSSYAFDLPNSALSNLILAAKEVAKLLDRAFNDVSRTGMIFEGYGVDHMHAKLYPMHGTATKEQWENIESTTMKQFFEKYPGYICSNDGPPAKPHELKKVAQMIRDANVK